MTQTTSVIAKDDLTMSWCFIRVVSQKGDHIRVLSRMIAYMEGESSVLQCKPSMREMIMF